MVIAILGNHELPYCTETDLARSFEKLGHRVLRMQENGIRTETILQQCWTHDVKLFVWVHTHTWTTPGKNTMEQVLDWLKSNGIKTCAFHLDLYFGLNSGDGRDRRVGQHAFWKCDYVFTADGGHQQEFAARGVNHFWLPPAILEASCYRGTPRDAYKTDVAFVGSDSYHPEYPFRSQLIGWLRQTYGPRFRRVNHDTPLGTLRERSLNDFYASAKVVVGDSCFAGIPNYWSDRVPETLGRYGFLIHPRVEGLNIPGLATFEPQNLRELKLNIDYYLTHDDEREQYIRLASAHVKQYDTYTQRCNTMLTTMELL